jgi:hypothetical protein
MTDVSRAGFAPLQAHTLDDEDAMNTLITTTHELRFQSMFEPGRGYSFPCDAAGCVPLDALSEQARNNYLFARALVGRDLAAPQVQPLIH